MTATSADLELARRLADIADEITLTYFERRNFTSSRKVDLTEVTQADQETENVLASEIMRERPQHGFYGEEFGEAGPSDSNMTWIIDPIDGTSNFTRGVPVWATLIALVDRTQGPVLGVVSAPALARRWWASRSRGAFVNGRSIRVSETAEIDEAQISVTFNKGWDDLGLTPKLVELQQRCYRTRGFGDFWQHMLVAEGAIDIAIDAIGLAPYDNAAVQIVVEEAGGRHTDRLGNRDFTRNSAVSSNGTLHRAVIEVLGS
ncbi:MAG: inositol monophosphatase family protein [Actinomycetota bacterium]